MRIAGECKCETGTVSVKMRASVTETILTFIIKRIYE